MTSGEAQSLFELHDVRYAYRAHPALDELTVDVQPGITGVLGPNGAGKSTLLRILAGLELAQGGSVVFDGVPISSRAAASELRESVGYLPQSPDWLHEVTVEELVTYFAASRLGRRRAVRQRVVDAIEAVDLGHKARVRIGRLSGGEARRAFLAQALVHDPAVLVLDEPTAGLDPVQRMRLREHVIAGADGRVVVWATHIVDDLVSLADRVVVLDEGRARWCGTIPELEELGMKQADSGRQRGASAGERGFLAALTGSRDERAPR